MPPKKDKRKGKQQQDDYWDTDFQQDANTITASTSNAEAEQPDTAKTTTQADGGVTNDVSEEFGGLMAAIKKSKGKKGKKQQQVEMVDANEELETMEVEAAPADTQSGDAITTAEKEEEEDQAGGEFRVKTKKEKEKEKKEKEKAKKKAQVSYTNLLFADIQADKKKAGIAPPAVATSAAPEPDPEPVAQLAKEDVAAEPEDDEGPEESTAGGYHHTPRKRV